jgi:septation ring formation regulator EzrA
MKKFMKIVSGAMVVVLLAGVMVFALPSQVVQAVGLEDQNPPVEGQQLGRAKQRLENAYSRQQTNLTKLGDRIEKLNDVSSKAQSRIDTIKANGKDTSSLESALSTFQAKIPGIEAAYEVAAGILSTHAGFGPNGKVVDIEAARNTVITAHDALGSTRQMLGEAVKTLWKAFKEFRAANPPAPKP